TDARNLETGFVNFRPHLQMMPGETCVLPQNQFPEIADITAGRHRWLGFSPEIGTVAHGKTKVPHLIRPETHPRTESRMLKVNFGRVPRFRTRREGRRLEFGGIIEPAQSTRHRNTGGVTGSPDDRIE